MTYSHSDIKQLPSMRMEDEKKGGTSFLGGNPMVRKYLNLIRIAHKTRNALRKQILSELTSKPTADKRKDRPTWFGGKTRGFVKGWEKKPTVTNSKKGKKK